MRPLQRLAVVGRHLGLLKVCPTLAGGAPAELIKTGLERPTLGAEVRLDLDDPKVFSAETGRLLRQALGQYAVLNIRTGEKPLDKETFERVVSLIAPVKRFVGTGRDGNPNLRYGEDMQTINAGKVLVSKKTGEQTRNGSWEFHSDDSYLTIPGRFTCLHPQELPPSGGGDTGFLDMRRAWSELPERKKQELSTLRCVHHFYNNGLFSGSRLNIVGSAKGAKRVPGEDLMDALHPLVRVVPETGAKALYMNLNRMKGIVGMATERAVDLLTELQRHAEAVGAEYRHHWRHGDIVVWDNAQVQHRAYQDFPMGEPRRMIRFMVGQEVPQG